MTDSSQYPYPVLTIDGPSGVGKGTIAQQLAKQLGWNLLDSGALYRCCAWGLLNDTPKGASVLQNPKQLKQFLQHLPIGIDGDQYYWRNINISQPIRQEKIGLFSSKVAQHPEIRTRLLELQRAHIKAPGLVADGRDMGNIVFPLACYKIYLQAAAETRAKRRLRQLEQSTHSPQNFQQILEAIEHRDRQDKNRPVAPLKPADDAWILDNSKLNIQQTLDTITNHFQLHIEP